MDLHIDDLNLSHHTKNVLHELGFTMVSDLKGYDYISLVQKFPLKRIVFILLFRNLMMPDIYCPRTMPYQFTMYLGPRSFSIFLREIISSTYRNYHYTLKKDLPVCAILESKHWLSWKEYVRHTI